MTSRRAVASAALIASMWGPAPARAAEPAELTRLPIEIELRHLCATATEGVRRLPDPGRARLITVLPFAGGADRATRDVRRLLSDYLAVVCLGGLRDLVVVEPGADLGAVGDIGARAERAAARGIDLVLSGEVTRGAVAYTVSARLLEADAAQTVATVMHPLPIEATDAYVTATLYPRTPAAAVLRSAVAPGWGQFYNDQPAKAALVISAEVILLGVAAAFYGAYADAWDAYQAPVPERVVHKEDATRYATVSLIAVGLAGAVWLGSVVDAWLSGYRYDPEVAFGGRSAVGPGVGADAAIGRETLGFTW